MFPELRLRSLAAGLYVSWPLDSDAFERSSVGSPLARLDRIRLHCNDKLAYKPLTQEATLVEHEVDGNCDAQALPEPRTGHDKHCVLRNGPHRYLPRSQGCKSGEEGRLTCHSYCFSAAQGRPK